MAKYMRWNFGVTATWIDKDSVDWRANASAAECVLLPKGMGPILGQTTPTRPATQGAARQHFG
jgi:hypothetical protein